MVSQVIVFNLSPWIQQLKASLNSARTNTTSLPQAEGGRENGDELFPTVTTPMRHLVEHSQGRFTPTKSWTLRLSLLCLETHCKLRQSNVVVTFVGKLQSHREIHGFTEMFMLFLWTERLVWKAHRNTNCRSKELAVYLNCLSLPLRLACSACLFG